MGVGGGDVLSSEVCLALTVNPLKSMRDWIVFFPREVFMVPGLNLSSPESSKRSLISWEVRSMYVSVSEVDYLGSIICGDGVSEMLDCGDTIPRGVNVDGCGQMLIVSDGGSVSGGCEVICVEGLLALSCNLVREVCVDLFSLGLVPRVMVVTGGLLE